MSTLSPIVDLLVERLLQASLVGVGAAGIVWLVTRAASRLAPDVRVALWWLVAAKMLLVLVWPVPVPVAILPSPPAPTAEVSVSPTAPIAASRGAPVATTPAGRSLRSEAAGSEPGAGFWRIPLITSWIAILCWLLLGDFGRSWRARREIDEAPDLEAGEARELFSELRDRFGAGAVRLRAGAEEEGARVVGLWRPVVALPPSLAPLPSRDLRLVLAHELLHVVRGDLWWGLLPALVERLFFFHPLALLAGREYRLAREAACDAAVLRRLDSPPREYGRLLLTLGAVLRLPSVGIGASSSRGHLKRRLEMLENANVSIRRRSILWLIPLAMVCLVPVELVARSPEPGTSRSAEPEEEWILVEDRDLQTVDAVETAEPTRTRTVTGNFAGDLSFVLLSGDIHTMHGSSRDVEAAELHRRGDEDLLFVRRGDGDWVIRDPALVAAAREILEPQRELGARQAELGAEQAELGSRQAELGARQASMGRSQAEVAARQAELAAEVQRHAATEMELAAREIRASSREERDGGEMERARRELEREREELQRSRRGVEERMRELERGMRSLGGDQGELGARQARLGAEQAKLGALQAELGRQQRRAAEKAHREMTELVERAISEGAAERAGG